MRFDDNILYCEKCSREISESEDHGYEDNPLCSGCWARDMQNHVKTPCTICKKPLGENPYHYNEDGLLAHSECVEDSEDPEEWSNEFD